MVFFNRRVLYVIIIVIFVFTGLSSCKSSNNKSKKDKNTLVVAISAEPKRLNPLFVTDSISHHISSLIFRGLTRLKQDLTIEGDLATHWEIKDGGRQVVFHLRNDVFWHDMKPFTAEDVVFTGRILMSKDTTSPHSQRFSNIVEIKALNSKTVSIRYNKPYGSMLESWTIGVLPKHIFEGRSLNDRDSTDNLIGTGPFRLIKWLHGQVIQLSPHEAFYGVKPAYKKLHIRILADETTQILEFKNESVDAFEASISQYNVLKEDERYNTYILGATYWVFWGFNLRDKTLGDIKFRQAMSHAIDKHSILKTVYHGLARLSNGPYPTNAWYFNKDAEVYNYDTKKAEYLLNELGFSKNREGIFARNGIPLTLELSTNYESKENVKIAQMIQNNLKEIGIRVAIKTYEWQTFRHRIIEEGTFQSVLLSRKYLYDPDISQLYHSKEAKKGGWNFLYYKNNEIDRLLEKGAETVEKNMRKKIYQNVHYILSREQACVFLYELQDVVVTQKNIILPEEIGLSLFDNIYKWSKI